MNNKQKYGQFYTTQYSYILQNLYVPEEIDYIIEPFCGEGHMLNIIDSENKHSIEKYDIDPKTEWTCRRDTLKYPPIYKDKFVLTNPPYLARNKSEDKEIFDKYDTNDLYKCFLKELLTNQCIGGILIIPLNFWSSIRASDIELRKNFLEVYRILYLNIFEEQVFDDTSYTVCSFQFEKRESSKSTTVFTMIYPSKEQIKLLFQEENNYTFGGEIYNLPINNNYSISRLTYKNMKKHNTHIVAKCIDDNEENQIGLMMVNEEDIYIDNTPKLSARSYATLIIEPAISMKDQEKLVDEFNDYLSRQRKKYHSLFLTNYRESKTIARKRISFDLVYNIVQYILETKIQPSLKE